MQPISPVHSQSVTLAGQCQLAVGPFASFMHCRRVVCTVALSAVTRSWLTAQLNSTAVVEMALLAGALVCVPTLKDAAGLFGHNGSTRNHRFIQAGGEKADSVYSNR